MKLSALFDPRYTLTVHVVQVILILLVFILAIARVSMTEVPITRANIMPIPISIKSLVVLTYQLLTEYNERFQKWASLKANMVLNIIEVIFWAVVMGLTFQANARICIGASCAVTWVVAVLCLVLLFLGVQAAVVSTLDWRHFRRYHYRRGSAAPLERDYENGHRMYDNSPLRTY
ncbi:hypothetical protein VUR80DRAFT_9851 [Thermomyces stellatus]